MSRRSRQYADGSLLDQVTLSDHGAERVHIVVIGADRIVPLSGRAARNSL